MKSAYRYFLSIPTRWKDNDIFGHINNVEYFSFVDTIITTFLVREGGFDIHCGPIVAVCAESHCRFRQPIAFPRRSMLACELCILAVPVSATKSVFSGRE
ncbi:MAG: acyl-CoA thioesterase [Chthoniobacterales bacterium]